MGKETVRPTATKMPKTSTALTKYRLAKSSKSSEEKKDLITIRDVNTSSHGKSSLLIVRTSLSASISSTKDGTRVVILLTMNAIALEAGLLIKPRFFDHLRYVIPFELSSLSGFSSKRIHVGFVY